MTKDDKRVLCGYYMDITLNNLLEYPLFKDYFYQIMVKHFGLTIIDKIEYTISYYKRLGFYDIFLWYSYGFDNKFDYLKLFKIFEELITIIKKFPKILDSETKKQLERLEEVKLLIKRRK